MKSRKLLLVCALLHSLCALFSCERKLSIDGIDFSSPLDEFYEFYDYETYRDLAVAYNFTTFTVSYLSYLAIH